MATYNSEIGHLTPLTSNAIDLTQRPSTGTDSPVTSNRRSRQKPAHPLHPQFHLNATQTTDGVEEAAMRRHEAVAECTEYNVDFTEQGSYCCRRRRTERRYVGGGD